MPLREAFPGGLPSTIKALCVLGVDGAEEDGGVERPDVVVGDPACALFVLTGETGVSSALASSVFLGGGVVGRTGVSDSETGPEVPEAASTASKNLSLLVSGVGSSAVILTGTSASAGTSVGTSAGTSMDSSAGLGAVLSDTGEAGGKGKWVEASEFTASFGYEFLISTDNLHIKVRLHTVESWLASRTG